MGAADGAQCLVARRGARARPADVGAASVRRDRGQPAGRRHVAAALDLRAGAVRGGGTAVSLRAARARRRMVVALTALWVVVPLLLMVARWPSWWSWIAPEQTPMTWLQSVVLVLAAAGSMLIAYVLRLSGTRRVTAWWVLAAGFGGLAFDERFAIHERVRDGVLAPRDITVPFLPWVAP